MKILITGFTPFGGENVNPSYEAIKLLPDTISSAEIYKVEIDTAYRTAFLTVKEAIDRIKPDYVLNVGQAGGRKTVTLEKVAINLKDASILDNEGLLITNQKIDENGPDGIFTTLDIVKIKEHLNALGYNVNISLSAGSFVCNYVMYSVLSYLKGKSIKADFIHVPYADYQVVGRDLPSMKVEDMAKILQEIINYLTQIK